MPETLESLTGMAKDELDAVVLRVLFGDVAPEDRPVRFTYIGLVDVQVYYRMLDLGFAVSSNVGLPGDATAIRWSNASLGYLGPEFVIESPPAKAVAVTAVLAVQDCAGRGKPPTPIARGRQRKGVRGSGEGSSTPDRRSGSRSGSSFDPVPTPFATVRRPGPPPGVHVLLPGMRLSRIVCRDRARLSREKGSVANGPGGREFR